MKSRFTYLVLSMLVVASMLLTACGVDPTATTIAPVPTNTTAPAAATNTTAPVAAATDTTAPVAAATDTVAVEAPTETPVPLSTAPPGSKTLRVNIGSEPATTDPQKMSFVGEIGWGEMVFEGLYELDLDLKPVPAAAEGTEISEDGLTYTVTLKEGLKYSDGTPLTANDFEYAFKRLFDPRIEGRDYASIAYVIKGAQELSELDMTTVTDADATVEGMMDELGVEATDDKTIVFTLNNKAAYFPFILAIWVGWPSRQDMVEQGGETWTEPATYIGNGPFVLSEWAHSSGAAFTGNENYREGKPKIERVEFRMIIDSAVSFQAYKQGELDVVGVAAEDLQAVQSDATLSKEFYQGAGNCTFYLGFNVQKPPFDNIKVRQAFSRAFDRDDYIEVVLSGLGLPAYSFIPPDRPGYNEDLKQPEFNPEEAKTMLDEVIASDYGGTLPAIKLTFSASPRNQTRFEWMQNQIKENLGLDVQLEPVESKAYTELVKKPETTPQFFFLGWCQDYPDPQNWLSLVFQSNSTVTHVGWVNEEFDRLTGEADTLTDFDARIELYDQAHALLVEETPVIFFYYNTTTLLIKPYISGMRENIRPDDANIPGFKNIANIDINK